MGLDVISNRVPSIANNLNSGTSEALNSAMSNVGANSGLIAQAEATAKDNLLRTIKATQWTAMMKTEKALLDQGVSLAKA